MPLKTHHHISSVKGLSSVTTLITGPTSSILIDPPFLLPDAESVVAWIKKTAPTTQLTAIFTTHHHPDHYFSANPILAAFPSARFLAAPYVCAGIDREYDEKVNYWPAQYGAHNFSPDPPAKPAPYPFSFVSVDGEVVVLIGPVQGDAVDHTLFWVPGEKTLVAGDAVYGRSNHVWAEEIESPAVHAAWLSTLDLIESLRPSKIIPGHIERGWELNAQEDLAHNRKYLQLFNEKIQQAPQKPTVDEIYTTFKDAFPAAEENLDFFLGHLSNQFGEGGKIWEENRHQRVAEKTREELEGWRMPL
ncbi:metallo-beta-lactamase domain protein [Diplodia corticola]|uniref:Metallo-beta-lactamase domain protein n=1 Tax=Diplodia corticola TaxID=236234 RepID=A0A1J9S9N3_9PEZI|nr:metallo-beta-lactamase domain protein [Diplodia corticola]OJD36604.1 metallo-beta-lactamase domain protein [Diplodia corticola]